MTDELPEMRASDAERERIAERLRDAVAEGRLDMTEFEERLDAAYRARTHGELEPLVRDLPAPSGTAAGTGAAPALADGGWASRIGQPATSRVGFAWWSAFSRRGRWTIGRAFTAVVIQAGGQIDLREANFEDRDIVIRCFALMGGVEVVVPPDMHVEVKGFGFMGGFDDSGDGEGTPGSPRVTVTGFALMGGIGVVRKRRKGLKAEKDRKELDG
ncbi:DUF1707 SHOCT-like domain-containing protein [Streptomyces sp. SP18CS02]|uniref:DUF1707 SHOCT-like domain-containing protein n=1 Tax=Streptomyces sp. SP18CS02 TaxID=3002531 RepID=UPI002E76E25B|nr:DUF1707 domain-containing protein [Streptomyces sp. SP18CS02]MEE1752318.1 DUF1707 domain-containing protein [Streptomyces sp. SP18CS02]